jgi:leucyl aminopeptidase
MTTVTLAASTPAGADVIGVGVFAGLQVAGDSALVDIEHLRARGWEAKVGDTVTLPGPDGTTVIAVGVGPAAEVDADVIRRASGALARAAAKRDSVVSLLLDALPDDGDRAAAAQAATEGALLGSYRYAQYKTAQNGTPVGAVTLVGRGGKKAASAVERGEAIAEAVAMARDLVNTPPGDLSPSILAKDAIAVAERVGLTVEVIDEKQARKLGMGGLVGVGQGSDNPPRLVKLGYVPDGARASLGLVGKGITFDSGGLSIKPADGMMTMKSDMSGAAAVLAAMSVLPALGGRVAVRGYLCAAENMPSGKAIRPGDVLRISNGTTVEVLNTDAEGRLVLADGLVTAVAEGADAVVDVATLTGACVVALGNKVAGLMGNHDGFLEQVRAAAERAGEPVWPLPLPEEYRKLIDSDVADIKNVSGGRHGGALTAGLFLREFVGGTPWAHLDIAGPAFADDSGPLHPKGATGFAVRTLVELATTFKRPARA